MFLPGFQDLKEGIVMKINKKMFILSIFLIFLPVVYGLLHWHELPDLIPTHWGLNGTPDGYSSKEFAVFGLPAVLALVHTLCCFGPKLDPKSKNYSDKLFSVVFWTCPVISIFCNFLVYAYTMGKDIDIPQLTCALCGVAFVIIGNYMPKVKQNYTMGIKLPWTLESEDNWYKTHKLAGIIGVLGGMLLIICAFLEIYTPIIVIMLLAVLIPTIYSYAIYKELKNEKNPDKE